MNSNIPTAFLAELQHVSLARVSPLCDVHAIDLVLGREGGIIVTVRFLFNDRMLQVMFAQILLMIPLAALYFCVFSNFLLGPSEFPGFKTLQGAPAGVWRSPFGSEKGLEKDVLSHPGDIQH